MILRSTKKLLQRTIASVKSFISGPSYQKLPKDHSASSRPLFDANSSGNYAQASNGELDRFYTDFSNRWDSEKPKKLKGKTKVPSSVDSKKHSENEEVPAKKDMICLDSRLWDKRDDVRDPKIIRRDRVRSRLIAKKLKELKMIDVSKEHVLDIEEILHLYSLLTCPVYLAIVEKFIMEVYTEFFRTDDLSSARTSWTGYRAFRTHA